MEVNALLAKLQSISIVAGKLLNTLRLPLMAVLCYLIAGILYLVSLKKANDKNAVRLAYLLLVLSIGDVASTAMGML